MCVTAHLFLKVCDVSASPDRSRWFTILKRLLISVVDYLVWLWPLILKRHQSNGQGDFAHMIIKARFLAFFLLLYSFSIFRNQNTISLSWNLPNFLPPLFSTLQHSLPYPFSKAFDSVQVLWHHFFAVSRLSREVQRTLRHFLHPFLSFNSFNSKR